MFSGLALLRSEKGPEKLRGYRISLSKAWVNANAEVKTLQLSQAMSLPQRGTVFPMTGAIECGRAKGFC